MRHCLLHLLGALPIINPEFENKENYTDIYGNYAEVGRGITGDDIVLDKKDLVAGKLFINEKLHSQAKRQIELLKEWYNRRMYLF